jgi:7-cyano-7-deazaguanine synthase
MHQEAMKHTETSTCLVILSGGQDSTTCLYFAKQHYKEVHAITFAYGQRHSTEVFAAKKIGEMAEVDSHHFLHLGRILTGTSPLIDTSIPLENYADWQHLPGGLEKTFVPGRNALFLVVAANWAYSKGIHDIITGICQEDSGGYPDCRANFRDAMEQALTLGTDYRFHICTPLMNMTKAQSVILAKSLPGCWEALAHTHTAYDGGYPPISNDHASLLRAKGFEQAGLPDPLVLRAWREGLMDLPLTTNYEPTRRQSSQKG